MSVTLTSRPSIGNVTTLPVGGGAARDRRLDHAMRREPQLPEALADRARVGRRLGAPLGPRVHAADDLDRSAGRPRTADRRRRAADARPAPARCRAASPASGSPPRPCRSSRRTAASVRRDSGPGRTRTWIRCPSTRWSSRSSRPSRRPPQPRRSAGCSRSSPASARMLATAVEIVCMTALLSGRGLRLAERIVAPLPRGALLAGADQGVRARSRCRTGSAAGTGTPRTARSRSVRPSRAPCRGSA